MRHLVFVTVCGLLSSMQGQEKQEVSSHYKANMPGVLTHYKADMPRVLTSYEANTTGVLSQ